MEQVSQYLMEAQGLVSTSGCFFAGETSFIASTLATVQNITIPYLIEEFQQMLTFSFMQRAILVGIMVSLCASLLGVSLVLKRYAMIGTSLSHVGFAAMMAAVALGVAPLAVALPMVVIAAFFMLRLNESSKINGDSAVALVSASSFAIGVLITSQTVGLSIHVCSAMFGSILVITQNDLRISIGLSVVVLVLFVLFYKQIFAVTYDETFARATGTRVELFKSLLAILTAITVVLGMRMMGALLISSLIILPPLTAMRTCKTFLSVVITSAIVGVVSFFIGIFIAFVMDWPPGASVVAVNLVIFICFCIVEGVKKFAKKDSPIEEVQL